jgi:dTDP-glucose pyrophosphorylase
VNIMILAAGQKILNSGEGYPFCLTEFDGKPIIQHLSERCLTLNPSKVIVALQEEDVRKHHLDDIVLLLMPHVQVIKIQGQTQGAACTALLASKYIDSDEELLIINGNELLDINFSDVLQNFHTKGLGAGVVVFNSIHPRYSYVRVDATGQVTEAAEKRPISRQATAGFYWFGQGRLFVEAAKNMIRKRASVNERFYICPTFNELVLRQIRIGVHAIDAVHYHPLKTERQVERLEAVIERSREHEYSQTA